MTELFRLDLREARAGLRRGDFSSEAYVAALLAHIAPREPDLRAWVWLDAEAALDKARVADATGWPTGKHGQLHGIPFGIKDIIDTAGIPTECGTPALKGRVPDRSAAVVRQLEAAGGFVMGKTVTAEMAFYDPGPTRNPWHPAHTPGGSSSGSAAAVAAGFVPAALGSQTNGSIIRPAAFCGVVGFKPSSGRISRAGVQLFSKTLDHIGVFTRSVADAALLVGCLGGFDWGDAADLDSALSFRQPDPDSQALDRPPRLALVRTPAWHLADAVQQENLFEIAQRLRAAGAQVDELELPPEFDRAQQVHHTLMFGEGARALLALQAAHRAQLGARLNGLIDEGGAIADDALEQALAARLELGRALHPILRKYDALITPPATGEAPATLAHTGDPAFCTIWTLTGVPTISIPSGFGPNGLPLGVQIVGGYLKDERLMAVAQWCEREMGFGPLLSEMVIKTEGEHA